MYLYHPRAERYSSSPEYCILYIFQYVSLAKIYFIPLHIIYLTAVPLHLYNSAILSWKKVFINIKKKYLQYSNKLKIRNEILLRNNFGKKGSNRFVTDKSLKFRVRDCHSFPVAVSSGRREREREKKKTTKSYSTFNGWDREDAWRKRERRAKRGEDKVSLGSMMKKKNSWVYHKSAIFVLDPLVMDFILCNFPLGHLKKLFFFIYNNN